MFKNLRSALERKHISIIKVRDLSQLLLEEENIRRTSIIEERKASAVLPDNDNIIQNKRKSKMLNSITFADFKELAEIEEEGQKGLDTEENLDKNFFKKNERPILRFKNSFESLKNEKIKHTPNKSEIKYNPNENFLKRPEINQAVSSFTLDEKNVSLEYSDNEKKDVFSGLQET